MAVPWWVLVSPYFIAELVHFGTVNFDRGEWGGCHYTSTKCFPIVILLALCLFLLKAEGRYATYHTLAVLASLFADILLASRSVSDSSFAMGIISFAIAHLCYLRLIGQPRQYLWPALLPIIALNGLVGYFCAEKILALESSLLIAVINAYGLLLSYTVFVAVSDWHCLRQHECIGVRTGVWLRLLGFLTFALSDTILTLDEFAFEIQMSQLPVIFSYYLAQILIFLGHLTLDLDETEGRKLE